jgi:serine/threonine protein kinase
MPGKNLLYEACMQQLVGERLADIGFQHGAPRVHRVFRLRDGSVGFAMEPIEGACTLDNYLLSVSDACLSNVIVDCLLQLCAMLWHLNHQVGINHRDLTPSNFLVVDHAPMRKILTIENDIIEISSTRSLTLIDFGFSCLGSPETQKADLSLSTIYPVSDPCPKEGRDLFQLIASMWSIPVIRGKFGKDIREVIHELLQYRGSSYVDLVLKNLNSHWIYLAVSDSSFRHPPLQPFSLLLKLNRDWNKVKLTRE